jgi:hypothetical protein
MTEILIVNSFVPFGIMFIWLFEINELNYKCNHVKFSAWANIIDKQMIRKVIYYAKLSYDFLFKGLPSL